MRFKIHSSGYFFFFGVVTRKSLFFLCHKKSVDVEKIKSRFKEAKMKYGETERTLNKIAKQRKVELRN